MQDWCCLCLPTSLVSSLAVAEAYAHNVSTGCVLFCLPGSIPSSSSSSSRSSTVYHGPQFYNETSTAAEYADGKIYGARPGDCATPRSQSSQRDEQGNITFTEFTITEGLD